MFITCKGTTVLYKKIDNYLIKIANIYIYRTDISKSNQNLQIIKIEMHYIYI